MLHTNNPMINHKEGLPGQDHELFFLEQSMIK